MIAQKEKPTHNGMQDSFADRIRRRPLHADRIWPSEHQGLTDCTYAHYEYRVPGRLQYGYIDILRILYHSACWLLYILKHSLHILERHYLKFCFPVAMLFNPCLFPCSCLPNNFPQKGLAGKPRRSHSMPRYVK